MESIKIGTQSYELVADGYQSCSRMEDVLSFSQESRPLKKLKL